jgi:hypothetical protein
MNMFIRRLRPAIVFVFGGALGGVCFVGVAWSASLVQIHAPIIHLPTVHTPKASTLETGSLKINTLKTSTPSTNQTQSTNNPGTGTGSSAATNIDKGHGNDSDKYPQGVRINENSTGSKGPTVTIDGKTMPYNSTTKELIKEAETPPPKMWLNGKLVPITPANEKKAEMELQSKLTGKSRTGMKIGGKGK